MSEEFTTSTNHLWKSMFVCFFNGKCISASQHSWYLPLRFSVCKIKWVFWLLYLGRETGNAIALGAQLWCYLHRSMFVVVVMSSWSVFFLPAEAGCSGVHEAGHHPGDGAQLQGLQAHQEADAAGGTHDGEAGEAAEDWAGEETPTETPGDSPVIMLYNKLQCSKMVC